MRKALESGTDPYLGFLDFRNTPTEGMNTSPAQRLFGRRTKTLLPSSGRLLKPRDADHTAQLLQDRKDKQAHCYDRSVKELQPLRKGGTVRIKRLRDSNRWTKATVDGKAGTRSYQVSIEDGRVYRRNRRHLRLTAEIPISTDPIPSTPFPSTTEEPQPETRVSETPRDIQPSSESGETPLYSSRARPSAALTRVKPSETQLCFICFILFHFFLFYKKRRI